MTNSVIEFYNNNIEETDSDIAELISLEANRQLNTINLIASENLVSKAVRTAQGSILTNKYAEGYPFARYYSGCEHVDQIEKLAQDRLCKLFSCDFANVQPHSGSQANQAVFNSLLKPGDKILGMSLNSGGHLTHGSKPNLSGKMFEAIQYNVDPETYLIDMDNVSKIAHDERPKLIIAGASAYSRIIDFKAFREIADSVGALLLADVAHYSGLIASKLYPSPVNYAHIITSTTHKTLRGPRGGVIMTNDALLHKKINSAVFPGLQGGPLMHVIAAKAVAFKEALDPSFIEYSTNVMNNAKILAQTLIDNGVNLVTNGTDCHMVIVDLRQNNRYGNDVADDLEEVGIICNKNSIPFDTEKPQITSGIRLGTAFETSKGLNENHFHEIGKAIADIIKKTDTKENIKSRLSHIHNGFDRIS